MRIFLREKVARLGVRILRQTRSFIADVLIKYAVIGTVVIIVAYVILRILGIIQGAF